MGDLPSFPVPTHVFAPTSASLHAAAEEIITKTRAVHARLIKEIPPDQATVENVLLPLAQAENALLTAQRPLITYRDFASDTSVREASTKAKELFDAFDIEQAMNEPLFQLLDAVQRQSAGSAALDEETSRYLEKIRRRHMENGLSLPAGPQRERFKTIKLRLKQLEDEFHDALSAAKLGSNGVWFAREELEGVPEAVTARFEVNDKGLLRASFNNADAFAVIRTAESAETRKRMYVAHENMVPSNVARLKEAAVLRDEAARMMGYASNAAWRIESKMANTSESVHRFLDQLKDGLAGAAQDEIRQMKELKRRHVGTRGEEFDGKLFLWDTAFYRAIAMKEELAVDQEALSEYFPFDAVVPGMLSMFEELLGFRFVQVGGEETKGRLWHDDVSVYGVWDAEDMGGEFVGYLYLDLHPRDGKVGYACSKNLIPGLFKDGHWHQHAATLLLTSFPKSTDATPSLLLHSQAVLLFHELGHCIHDLASRTRFALLYGPDGTSNDFLEAPSQLLENWFWAPSVLATMGRHYSYLSPAHLAAWQAKHPNKQQPPEKILTHMIDGLVASKTASRALGTLREAAIAAFDMAVHAPASTAALESMDLPATYNRIRKELCHLDDAEELGEGEGWGHGFAIYPHLMDGYDAGFYSYLWSRSIAADIFYGRFEEDPMDQAEGRRYRRAVLEKGSVRDELEMLIEYLGREPSPTSFFRELGIA